MNQDPFDSFRSLDGWSEKIVRRLVVIIIGCGALGSAVAEMLGAMGVGCLILIDDDTVASRNLLRMALVSQADVGRTKVLAAAEGLRRRFGDLVRVVPLVGSAQAMLGLGLVRRADAVFLCADNRAGRLHGARMARAARTPHISGAIDGTLGMVSGVFSPPESACYECTLTEKERRELLPVHFSCVPPSKSRAASVPTSPVAASITAAWMTQILLRYAHGERGPLLGRRLFINPLRDAVQSAQFPRRLSCSCATELDTPTPFGLSASSGEMSAGELLRAARSSCGDEALIALDYTLVIEDICRNCGRGRKLVVPRHEAAPGYCAVCSAQTTPVAWTNVINGSCPLANLSFSQLALPLLHPISVRGPDGVQAFELSGDAALLGLLEPEART